MEVVLMVLIMAFVTIAYFTLDTVKDVLLSVYKDDYWCIRDTVKRQQEILEHQERRIVKPIKKIKYICK